MDARFRNDNVLSFHTSLVAVEERTLRSELIRRLRDGHPESLRVLVVWILDFWPFRFARTLSGLWDIR